MFSLDVVKLAFAKSGSPALTNRLIKLSEFDV